MIMETILELTNKTEITFIVQKKINNLINETNGEVKRQLIEIQQLLPKII